MPSRTLENATPDQLASLLTCEMPAPPWSSVDLADMWRQLLSVSILEELDRVGATTNAVANACDAAIPVIARIEELLGHPTPPVLVLDAIRRMAKIQAASNEGAGSGTVARALYFTTLATGFNAKVSTTKLSDAQFVDGLEWAIAQPWIDEKTRAVLQQAMSKTQKGGHS